MPPAGCLLLSISCNFPITKMLWSTLIVSFPAAHEILRFSKCDFHFMFFLLSLSFSPKRNPWNWFNSCESGMQRGCSVHLLGTDSQRPRSHCTQTPIGLFRCCALATLMGCVSKIDTEVRRKESNGSETPRGFKSRFWSPPSHQKSTVSEKCDPPSWRRRPLFVTLHWSKLPLHTVWIHLGVHWTGQKTGFGAVVWTRPQSNLEAAKQQGLNAWMFCRIHSALSFPSLSP